MSIPRKDSLLQSFLISLVSSALFMYTAIAFINWELHPALWDAGARVVFVLGTMLMTILGTGIQESV